MDNKPNIILITIDCLRADYCGWLNPERKNLTPFLNGFAKESLIFTNAYATGPNTPYAFTGILTGTYLDLKQRLIRKYILSDINNRPYLPEILHNNGYSTMAVHDNPFLSAYFGCDKGFDIFKDLGYEKSLNISQQIYLVNKQKHFKFTKIYYSELIKIYNFIKNAFSRPKITSSATAKEINEVVLKNLQPSRSPFFLWIHYMDSHEPYSLPNLPLEKTISNISFEDLKKINLKESIASYHFNPFKKNQKLLLKKLYEMEIQYIDQQIKYLLNQLESLSENSIIVIVADHGEEFMEHGGWGHSPSIINSKLHRELIHVPLLIRMPNKISKQINENCSCAQIPATLLKLSNIHIPKRMEPSLFSKNSNIYSESIIPLFQTFFNNTYFCPGIRKKIEIKNL